MHLEILVEDQSGKVALDLLLPKILGNQALHSHTFKVISYKGIGRIPKGMKAVSETNQRILLDQLPRLLRGYGKAHQDYPAAVIVVCDLDDKSLKIFRAELLDLLAACHPQPQITKFCLAIEEGEAWLLGDLDAIKTAYPKAKNQILNQYNNDSICGTWEILANAIYPGGVEQLKKKGWQTIGAEKTTWAEKIVPHMQLDSNQSPSFMYFYHCIKALVMHQESQ